MWWREERKYHSHHHPLLNHNAWQRDDNLIQIEITSLFSFCYLGWLDLEMPKIFPFATEKKIISCRRIKLASRDIDQEMERTFMILLKSLDLVRPLLSGYMSFLCLLSLAVDGISAKYWLKQEPTWVIQVVRREKSENESERIKWRETWRRNMRHSDQLYSLT